MTNGCFSAIIWHHRFSSFPFRRVIFLHLASSGTSYLYVLYDSILHTDRALPPGLLPGSSILSILSPTSSLSSSGHVQTISIWPFWLHLQPSSVCWVLIPDPLHPGFSQRQPQHLHFFHLQLCLLSSSQGLCPSIRQHLWSHHHLLHLFYPSCWHVSPPVPSCWHMFLHLFSMISTALDYWPQVLSFPNLWSL